MTLAVAMLAPSGFSGQFIARSGMIYTPNALGVVLVNQGDVVEAHNAGFSPINFGDQYVGRLLGANFNSTADQAIPLFVPAGARFRITKATVENTSVNGMSTAAGGIYNAASKGGTALVAAGQVYTGLTNANTALDLTLAVPNAVQAAAATLYLSLTTPQGAPATADVYLFGQIFN
ncbi:MAG TPA: hypothetical protein VFA87_11195 [Rhizomicrobium sp.]|nr:hypothetical protein [Rhizomicrobium sp.]